MPEIDARGSSDAPLQAKARRQVFFGGAFVDAAIYDVTALRADDEMDGPCVIEDPRSTNNERAVHLLLGGVSLLAGAFLVAGVLLLTSLTSDQAALAAAAARDESAADATAAEAADVLRRFAGGDPDRVAAAAADGNVLIDRRLFSWTALFNHLEQTLPAGVMLVSVQPRIGGSGATVALDIVGRSVAEIGTFIDALEATGAFSGVLPRDEEATVEGTYRTRLVAQYVPTSAAGAAVRETVR